MEVELPSKGRFAPENEGNDSDDSMASIDSANLVDEARKSLENAPTFEAHAKYISALRLSGSDFVGLRAARETFSSLYPLPPSMWLEWVNDELSVNPGMATKKYVLKTVLSRAIFDYLSIPVCKHYLTLMLDLNPGGVSECVKTLRNMGALTHFIESSSLWSLLIEKNYLKAEEMNSVPLVEHEDSDNISEDVGDLVAGCVTFEKKLIESGSNPSQETGMRDDELKSRYMSYASYLTDLNVSCAKSVWERCVSECFLDPNIWVQYAAFLREHGSLSEEKRVLNRARRNVPWDYNGVWNASISNIAGRYEKQKLGLEGAKSELSELVKLLPRSSSKETANVERTDISVVILMCYRILASIPNSDELERIIGFNETGMGGWINSKFCMANVMFAEKDMESCIWHVEDVLKTSPTYADVWNRAIHLLIRASVSPNRVEELLREGINTVASRRCVESLARTWVDFHSSSNTSSTSYSEIQGILKKRLDILPEQRVGAGNNNNKPVRKPRKEEANVGEKRKTREAPKRRKVDAKEEKVGNENGNAGTAKHKKDNKDDVLYEKNTIFINNFHYKATEADVRERFGECGAIRDIRIPKRGDGATKGIAYVEFEDEESTKKALALHEAAILGRTIRVFRSKPPRGGIPPAGASKRGGRTTRGRGRGGTVNRRMVLNMAGLGASGDNDTGDKSEMMDTTTPAGTSEKSGAANDNTDNTAKTQEDFRAMLFGVKKEVKSMEGDKEASKSGDTTK